MGVNTYALFCELLMNATVPQESLGLDYVRRRLSQVWFGGCGIIFLILLLQSFGSVYREQLSEVWSWALPTMMPTLSLIVSALGAEALVSRIDSDKEAATSQIFDVRPEFYRLAFWLSVTYLMVIVGTIFAQPLMRYFQSEPDVTQEQVLESFHLGTTEVPEQPAEAAASTARPADILKMSNLWLAPFQSLVVAAIGVVFFTKRERSRLETLAVRRFAPGDPPGKT